MTDTDFLSKWAARSDVYAENLVAWAEDQWVVKNTGDLIRFESHQKDLLRTFFTRGGVLPSDGPRTSTMTSSEFMRGEYGTKVASMQHDAGLWDRLTPAGQERMRQTPEGKFPWPTMIWSEPKKSGKTEIGGLVGLWVTLSEPGINEAFFIANDQEQSQGRAYARITDHLNPASPCYNPAIASYFRTRVKETTRPPSRLDFRAGDFMRAIPTDYAGESGANPTISIWDELWAYVRENLMRLWEEFTVVPTRRNSLQFVTTYAGFREESELLWRLYQRTVRHGVRIHKDLEVYESQAGDTVAYWSHTPRMPWQTPEYYKMEKGRLRPNAYLRLHKNMWTRSESAFIDSEQWDALPRTAIKPAPSKKFPVYVACDASHKRDATAGIAVGWHKDGYPFLVRHGLWVPTKDEPVIPEDTLGPWIDVVRQDFDVRRIVCDPNHMETMILRLMARGLPVEEYLQTTDNLTRAGDALYTYTRQGLFVMYPCPNLDKHVLAATAKETAKGWRLTKELATSQIDMAVALAMALATARLHGPEDVNAAPMMFWLGGVDEQEETVPHIQQRYGVPK